MFLLWIMCVQTLPSLSLLLEDGGLGRSGSTDRLNFTVPSLLALEVGGNFSVFLLLRDFLLDNYLLMDNTSSHHIML